MIQFDSSLADTMAARISNAFAAAGWSVDTTRAAALRAGDVPTAQRIIAAGKSVPESVRCAILRDKALQTIEQVFQALEISAYVQLAMKSGGGALPENFRSPRAYMLPTENSERLMSVQEAREALVRALATADQHIDTSRRADPNRDALQSAAEKRYGPGASIDPQPEGRPLVGDAFAQPAGGRK